LRTTLGVAVFFCPRLPLSEWKHAQEVVCPFFFPSWVREGVDVGSLSLNVVDYSFFPLRLPQFVIIMEARRPIFFFQCPSPLRARALRSPLRTSFHRKVFMRFSFFFPFIKKGGRGMSRHFFLALLFHSDRESALLSFPPFFLVKCLACDLPLTALLKRDLLLPFFFNPDCIKKTTRHLSLISSGCHRSRPFFPFFPPFPRFAAASLICSAPGSTALMILRS